MLLHQAAHVHAQQGVQWFVTMLCLSALNCVNTATVAPSLRSRPLIPTVVPAVCLTDCTMLMQPESLVGKRAFFASKHLFVTPHNDDQLFPAGDHVVQSEDCLGLKQWTQEVREHAAQAVGMLYGAFVSVTHCRLTWQSPT